MGKTEILKFISGQVLSLILSVAALSASFLNTNTNFIPFYALSMAYIVIHIGGHVLYLFQPANGFFKINIFYYVVAGMTDFLGGYFQLRAYKELSSYIVVMLSQMNTPITMILESFVFKTSEFDYILFIEFFALVIAILCINYFTSVIPIKISLLGIFYILLSDLCCVTNGFIQAKIIPEVGIGNYLKGFTLFGFLTGFMMTGYFYRDYVFNIRWSLNFYSKNYVYLFLYTISLSTFYLSASKYINSFGLVAFTASLISVSLYFGNFERLIQKEYNLLPILGSLVCIIFNAYIVYSTKNPIQ
ncbi:hypothetical protein CWI37_0819p0020 [Hamiltosporidium tvaerminnensis]|uniref:Uncharacterized protein n=2 Tax=Hamiltosporidium TaxID=1176354 RepID=A0A4Q9LG99_9MICR|nr:hypothetical protein LUQ84_3570 [Hamiltosporidium tvaerminnensis]TBT99525.1 hypothetical protein CWI36_1948p0010 [Hamiltosporidium magnivora]TBU00489.1 hypothetical protein CWI37_0987p0010 [Hamiltosporidium tvaerminnensis]TBU01057.1 hypothetical protein CWI37_0819p0020 [Hamiltosporidium tvaerminnensis]TBU06455.1 hypothetical protein CWI39_0490p0020 [Hamiltosporidium magnivora]